MAEVALSGTDFSEPVDFAIVYCHPRKASLNGQILEAFRAGCTHYRKSHVLFDLHAMGFVAGLGALELTGPDLSPPPPPADIAFLRQEIRRARTMVFIYPVYWFSAPALVKGFFDRCLGHGFGYILERGVPRGLLAEKRALAINTYGSSWWVAKWWMGNCHWRWLKEVVFKGLGIRDTREVALYSSRRLEKATVEGFLAEIYSLPGKF